MAENTNTDLTVQDNPIKEFFAHESVVKKFTEIIGNRAPAFVTSVLQITAASDSLRNCIPKTIFTAAATAASMDLPINPQLGFAHIVAYDQEAQFQIGWKGYVQLALRTGAYHKINVREVHKNQFKFFNELTEDFSADFSIEGDGTIVGYVAYFRLLSGFEKVDYWTRKKVEAHGKKYSKSYDNPKGQWKKDFDGMAKKTVVKNILSKWGVLSLDLQRALIFDQSVILDADGNNVKYIDNIEDPVEKIKNRSKSSIDLTMNKMSGNQQ